MTMLWEAEEVPMDELKQTKNAIQRLRDALIPVFLHPNGKIEQIDMKKVRANAEKDPTFPWELFRILVALEGREAFDVAMELCRDSPIIIDVDPIKEQPRILLPRSQA